ncbi:uncharacterized protein LOC110430496 [Sorghum bicolor]|uniref:uncharacterized protein LOC110430496 n=1 Tax=Sorghum bicolor TaxID=4558 RepID=UPI000B4257D3|nr:uncharacterized protein LOC110430496 [Sorghum bicolor]|eukprot:XP_021303889.1 uncharacterized protein LOC110430496 [Sorghum bicolor]
MDRIGCSPPPPAQSSSSLLPPPSSSSSSSATSLTLRPYLGFLRTSTSLPVTDLAAAAATTAAAVEAPSSTPLCSVELGMHMFQDLRFSHHTVQKMHEACSKLLLLLEILILLFS